MHGLEADLGGLHQAVGKELIRSYRFKLVVSLWKRPSHFTIDLQAFSIKMHIDMK